MTKIQEQSSSKKNRDGGQRGELTVTEDVGSAGGRLHADLHRHCLLRSTIPSIDPRREVNRKPEGACETERSGIYELRHR